MFIISSKKDYWMLRHVTNKKYLKSIISNCELSSYHIRRKLDDNYISFESNPFSNKLVEVFHLLKDSWEKDQVFELLFDAQRLLRDGYKIYSSINGKYMGKKEIDFHITGKWNEEISVKVNDYAFIKERVPLFYLAKESKDKLLEWAKENNIIYNCDN